jgi:nucleotide-binding universal stress UspA family protein
MRLLTAQPIPRLRGSKLHAETQVMGAYGRSRLREAILDGATREMLKGCESALFLAR